jgi:pterin-4a-carbinolamine dehydratase
VNRVAEAAEEVNHHPGILVHGWNKVRLALTNHSAEGSLRSTSRWRASSTDSSEAMDTIAL